MTPDYRKASIKVLVDWSHLAHNNPQRFIRRLAETTDEGLLRLIQDGDWRSHSDLPSQSFLQAITDFEAGRIVDLEKALTEPYPEDPEAA